MGVMQEMVMVWLIVYFMFFIIAHRMFEVFSVFSKSYHLTYNNTDIMEEYLIENE